MRDLTELEEDVGRYYGEVIFDAEIAPPIGHAHLTAVDEFRKLFTDDFEELTLVAVESFSGPWQGRLMDRKLIYVAIMSV